MEGLSDGGFGTAREELWAAEKEAGGVTVLAGYQWSSDDGLTLTLEEVARGVFSGFFWLLLMVADEAFDYCLMTYIELILKLILIDWKFWFNW